MPTKTKKKPRKPYTWKSDESRLNALKNLVHIQTEEKAREFITQEKEQEAREAVNRPVLPAEEPATYQEMVLTARGNTLAAYETIINIMTDPEASHGSRIKCAEIILERGWGKAISPVSGTIPTEKQIEGQGMPQIAQTVIAGVEPEDLPANKAAWARQVAEEVAKIKPEEAEVVHEQPS